MFQEFVKKLSEELKKELPGFSAQKQMAPLGRKPPSDYLGKITPKKSAVLMLLFPGTNHRIVKTVFILRPDTEGGSHVGQVALPGGGLDTSDKDLSETALREAEEEIGVDRNSVSLLGGLTPLYIPVSNYMVHPFIGVSNKVPEFKMHPIEVRGLLEADLAELFSEKNKKEVEKFIKVKNRMLQVPCYEIKGEVIWGATAMILSEFSEIIKRMK